MHGPKGLVRIALKKRFSDGTFAVASARSRETAAFEPCARMQP